MIDDSFQINIEELGLDLEYIINDAASFFVGGVKKNYFFNGRKSPYGYSTVIGDDRLYCGLSFAIFGDVSPSKIQEELDQLPPMSAAVTVDTLVTPTASAATVTPQPVLVPTISQTTTVAPQTVTKAAAVKPAKKSSKKIRKKK